MDAWWEGRAPSILCRDMAGHGVPAEWREQVLDQTLHWAGWLGALLAVVSTLSFLRSQPERLLEPGFLLMFAAFGCIWLLRYRPFAQYRPRALAFCWLLWLLGSAALYNVGPLTGPVLCNSFAVLSAGLFLSRRAMWLLLAVTTLGVTLFDVWNAAGYLPVAHVPMPVLALRVASGYAAITGAMALLVRHVVAQIEHSLSATSEALRRLKVAEQERTRTERALQETELALQRSQKLEAVGRLAAGVGHDFNNSLQVVLSWSSLLQGEEDPVQLEEGLNAIRQAALQGSELTQRLLTFGRRDVHSAQTLPVQSLLEDGARSLRRMLPEDISIDIERHDRGAHILVDAAQLAHVFLNLGLNARDAMPTGGRLALMARRLRRHEMPAGLPWPNEHASWVELSVTDSGVGMSPETLAHLFEPFFTTKGERGNGLGLATSYALVQRNAGFIRAESELGRGSAFHIYFPEHAAVSSPVTASEPAPRGTQRRGVMVAEDDDNVRSSLVRVLGAAGFHVFESADAASAIQMLERVSKEVDVLCTDGIMPGGGTRELIDRYLSRRPEGKVILCSGYMKEELLRRQIDAGALAYLAKPFLPQELVERIHVLLNTAAAAAPS
jgi:signal transduction histidine kinase/ActR/RegA family two-component response regulator